MGVPWSRVVHSTIKKYIREREINILRNRKLLALLLRDLASRLGLGAAASKRNLARPLDAKLPKSPQGEHHPSPSNHTGIPARRDASAPRADRSTLHGHRLKTKPVCQPTPAHREARDANRPHSRIVGIVHTTAF